MSTNYDCQFQIVFGKLLITLQISTGNNHYPIEGRDTLRGHLPLI